MKSKKALKKLVFDLTSRLDFYYFEKLSIRYKDLFRQKKKKRAKAFCWHTIMNCQILPSIFLVSSQKYLCGLGLKKEKGTYFKNIPLSILAALRDFRVSVVKTTSKKPCQISFIN
jgi:hypothetical protein